VTGRLYVIYALRVATPLRMLVVDRKNFQELLREVPISRNACS